MKKGTRTQHKNRNNHPPATVDTNMGITRYNNSYERRNKELRAHNSLLECGYKTAGE